MKFIEIYPVPILKQEIELFPPDLLEREEVGKEHDKNWWAIYTTSRREKEIMRRLEPMGIPFYCPIIPVKKRSPAGRIRVSYLPMFSNYVFVYGNQETRYQAWTTNCVSQCMEVPNGQELTKDLRQIKHLIEVGAPLTIEELLQPGNPVRVKSGLFAGYEGVIVERRGERHLLVAVNFLQQGVSVKIEDFAVEAI